MFLRGKTIPRKRIYNSNYKLRGLYLHTEMESSKCTGQLISIPIPVKLRSCCCRYAAVTRGNQLVLHSNSHNFFLYQVWPQCRCAFSLEILFDRSISLCFRRAQRTVGFLRFVPTVCLKVPTQNFRKGICMKFRNINLLCQDGIGSELLPCKAKF